MTGRQSWNTRGKGSLTYADGMLYCLDERGTMTLVKATPEAHRPAGSFKLPKGGGGLYWATSGRLRRPAVRTPRRQTIRLRHSREVIG